MKSKENKIQITSDCIDLIRDIQNPNMASLAIMYATNFWAGSWQELLINPNTGTQYGTYGTNGEIYSETQKLLQDNQIEPKENWPREVWERAGQRSIFVDGIPLRQFWTIESATNALQEFIKPIDQDGYGGEIMILKDAGEIAGFAAYTIADIQNGPALVQKRFSYPSMPLKPIVQELFPDQKVGVFLDFAINENFRGKGIGSQLFDLRLNRMIAQGAEVIIGRTIKTSPAQFYGNYIARGMEPFAVDPTNSDKQIFAVKVNNIKPR